MASTAGVVHWSQECARRHTKSNSLTSAPSPPSDHAVVPTRDPVRCLEEHQPHRAEEVGGTSHSHHPTHPPHTTQSPPHPPPHTTQSPPHPPLHTTQSPPHPPSHNTVTTPPTPSHNTVTTPPTPLTQHSHHPTHPPYITQSPPHPPPSHNTPALPLHTYRPTYLSTPSQSPLSLQLGQRSFVRR